MSSYRAQWEKCVLAQASPFTHLVSGQGWPKDRAQQDLSTKAPLYGLSIWLLISGQLCSRGCLPRANISKGLSGSLLWFSLQSDTASLVPYSIDGNSQILLRSRWGSKDPNSWLKKYHRTGGHILKLPQEGTGWMSILLLTETAVGCQFLPHHQVSCSLCWSEAKLSPSPNLASQ